MEHRKHTLTQLAPVMEGLQQQVAGFTTDKVIQVSQVYAEQDGCRLLLGGQRLKIHFDMYGAASMLALMVESL